MIFYWTRGYLPSFRTSPPLTGTNLYCLHILCVNDLPRVASWQRNGLGSNLRLVEYLIYCATRRLKCKRTLQCCAFVYYTCTGTETRMFIIFAQKRRTSWSTTALVCLQSGMAILGLWELTGRHSPVSTALMPLYTYPQSLMTRRICTSSRFLDTF